MSLSLLFYYLKKPHFMKVAANLSEGTFKNIIEF